MVVIFYKYKMKNIAGRECYFHPAGLGTDFYLKSISAPRKTPISFVQAMELCWSFHGKLGSAGQYDEAAYFIQKDDWAEFISQNGYHIEFTGNEFMIAGQSA